MPRTTPEDARAILRNPEANADTPDVYAAAWAELKRARGHGLDPARIGPAHYLIERDRPDPDPLAARIAARLATRRAAGLPTAPAPLILRRVQR